MKNSKVWLALVLSVGCNKAQGEAKVVDAASDAGTRTFTINSFYGLKFNEIDDYDRKKCLKVDVIPPSNGDGFSNIKKRTCLLKKEDGVTAFYAFDSRYNEMNDKLLFVEIKPAGLETADDILALIDMFQEKYGRMQYIAERNIWIGTDIVNSDNGHSLAFSTSWEDHKLYIDLGLVDRYDQMKQVRKEKIRKSVE